MALDAWDGTIKSKTKLQKIIYFISLLLNRDLGFKAHYYGPYSTDVEIALDELIGAGFVDVKHDVWGYDTKCGFESKRYTFSLTESGKKFARSLEEENHSDYSKIKEFIDKLKEIGNPDYLSLSIAAKSYFIREKEGKTMTKDEIKTKANSFGWRINNNDVDIAVNILSKLNFVKEE